MDNFENLSLGSISLETSEESVPEYEIEEKKNQFIEKLMKLYLRHNITLICLEDVVQLLNERPDDFKKLPSGKVQLMELFESNSKSVVDIFLIIKCDECRTCTTVKKEKTIWRCSSCNSTLKRTETNYFISMPIEGQIRKSLRDNWHYINNFDTTTKESYSDVHDGSILKNVLKEYRNSDINILSLCLNVDGANKFKSNQYSVWPIQLVQNYLPPKIRFKPKNIIVCGLHYSVARDENSNNLQLNFRDFLLPLITELKQFKVNNIKMKMGAEERSFKPIVTHCSIDLPAKSKVQETKQCGGYYACTFCEIPGESVSIKTNPKKIQPTKPTKLVKFVRYVENGTQYKLRNEIETLRKMYSASLFNGKTSIDGIKGMIEVEIS